MARETKILWSLGPLSRVDGWVTNGWMICGCRFNDFELGLGSFMATPLVLGALVSGGYFWGDFSRRSRLVDGHCRHIEPGPEHWSDDDGGSGYRIRWIREWTVNGERFSGPGVGRDNYRTAELARAAALEATPPEVSCLVDPEDVTWVTEYLEPPWWQLWLALVLLPSGPVLVLLVGQGEGPTSITVST